jgi:hypothetical protein
MSGRRCDPAVMRVALNFLFRGNSVPSPKAHILIGRAARVLPHHFVCQVQKNRAEILTQNQKVIGAPEEIRTPDPQIRSNEE